MTEEHGKGGRRKRPAEQNPPAGAPERNGADDRRDAAPSAPPSPPRARKPRGRKTADPSSETPSVESPEPTLAGMTANAAEDASTSEAASTPAGSNGSAASHAAHATVGTTAGTTAGDGTMPGSPSGNDAGVPPAPTFPPPSIPETDLRRLLDGHHSDPHSILGAHPAQVKGVRGVVVRTYHPAASDAELLLEDGATHPMQWSGDGIFAVFLPDAALPLRYRIRLHFPDGGVWERGDPYRFMPTLGDLDLHLFNEGSHRRLWDKLGAHCTVHEGVAGVAFAVWAPNARRVSVIGDFCGWDGRLLPMRLMGSSGVFELFVPDIGPNALYKFELVTREGQLRVKTDPFAFKMEQAPANASIVVRSEHQWGDEHWMLTRAARDPLREPMAIYEVHLGSWARVPEEGNRWLSYREIAPRLVEHVKRLGFTHIELLPIMEHPFYGSWGYQVSGYFAPTSRYGAPDDFRYLVDCCHQAGIGVILDWVPAHFPKDDYALRRFDGTALYEHEDPRLGEHPDWGTLIFNYGRAEVKNFLLANALYWLEEFHIDGLRVDAVASMLYLDYSREPGEWMRNRLGGRENLEAIDFLRAFNETIRHEAPGCITVAEESTAWPGVTRPVSEGGLGFTLKWNMGWMHDTLNYFALDPIHRRHHQNQLTFAMMYEYSEHFVMPLSHDEVVHLKKPLIGKMPGDSWQQMANLRLLLAYQFTRPSKKLLFMGAELATPHEWNHDASLDWHLAGQPDRQALQRYLSRLGWLYRERSPFWRRDPDLDGFTWIDVSDRENSVLSYVRRDGGDHVVVVLNMTPMPRDDYRVGTPEAGTYVEVLSSDDMEFGGSGHPTRKRVETQPSPFHGYPQSMALNLPPLGALVLVPERMAAR